MKELRNRLARGARPLLAALGVLVAGALLGGTLLLAGRAVVDGAPADPERFAAAAFERTFWVNALVLFVLGFTSFEALFRSAEGQRLESLPLPRGALYIERVLALAALHAPLLLGALLFHAPLLAHTPRLFAHALVVQGGTWAFGLAVAMWVHILAGRSLLSGASGWKGFLGDGYHTNEAAMVLYSPGAAFGLSMFAAVPLDLLAREYVTAGALRPALVGLALLALVGAAALTHGALVYRRCWTLVRARFNEAELLRPWHEHDLPRAVLGERLAAFLPPTLAALYRKDLRQLRRRHRLDLALLVAAVIGLALFHLRTELDTAALLRLDAALLAIAVGAVLTPVYKLTREELEPEGFLRVLPVAPALVRHAKALVALTHQVPLALAVAALYGLAAGAPLAAAALAVTGGVGGYLLSRLFLALALGRRRRGEWLAWTFRGAVAALALVAAGIAG